MLRAFQSGSVAKQFGKLVGRKGGADARVGVLEVDDDAGGADDVLASAEAGVGGQAGLPPGAEGFSATDRLLGAVRGRCSSWKRFLYLAGVMVR